jgi:hypothetical protein
MPGSDWCHQMPEESGMLRCVALPDGDAVCPMSPIAPRIPVRRMELSSDYLVFRSSLAKGVFR